jgi:DNA-binding transcriptional ArsR family regulator
MTASQDLHGVPSSVAGHSLSTTASSSACRRGYTGQFPKHVICFWNSGYSVFMGSWSFLTNHARTLLCIAADPGVRLRDIATSVGITERRAHAIVTDLVDAGYVVKDRDGRRNQYRIQTDLPLRDPINRQRTIGELIDLLVGSDEHGEGISPRDRRRLTAAARRR